MDISVVSVGGDCGFLPEWETATLPGKDPISTNVFFRFLQPKLGSYVKVASATPSQSRSEFVASILVQPLTLPTHIGSITLIVGGLRAILGSASGRVLMFHSPFLEDSVCSLESTKDGSWPGVVHLPTITHQIEFLRTRYISVLLKNAQSDSDEGFFFFAFFFNFSK